MNSTKAIRNLQHYYEKQVEDIHFTITKNIENGFIVKNINFDYQNQPHHFQERVKALEFDEFQSFFNQSGLRCLDVFGNYALEKFDLDHSDRMIFVVEKY